VISVVQSALVHDRTQRIARPWRWAFVIYLLTLTIATHWPNLRLGPEVPASDKMIHLLGFGTLALLLWQTRRIGSRWLIWIITVAWALLDELTQGIPALNRTVTWEDMLANTLGVTVAVALLWASKPLGDPDALNQRRLRLMEFGFEEMFSRREPWVIGIGGLIASALLIFIASRFLEGASLGTAGLIIVAVAAIAMYFLCRRVWLREMARIRAVRPCLTCGSTDISENVCTTCGTRRVTEVFDLPQRPPWRRMLRLGLGPVLLAVAATLLIFAAILITPIVYDWLLSGGAGGVGSRSFGAPRLARWIGTLPPELTSAIDVSLYLLIVATVVRMYRTRLARWHDRAAVCEACGHDLRGTPTDETGSGHCGECGRSFLRKKD